MSLLLGGFFLLFAIAIGLIVYDSVCRNDDVASFHRYFRGNRRVISRGTWSEIDLLESLVLMGFNRGAIFHDLYLRNAGGNFTQIDLVLATKVGIIVFEVKDYRGWIFGNAYQEYWTQILAYGKDRYQFYNPILQNQTHVENLKKRLFLQNKVPFYSVIVFYGDCEIKTDLSLSENTFLIYEYEIEETIDNIMQSGTEAQYPNKREIISILNDAVKNGEDPSVVSQHINNIKTFVS